MSHQVTTHTASYSIFIVWGKYSYPRGYEVTAQPYFFPGSSYLSVIVETGSLFTWVSPDNQPQVVATSRKALFTCDKETGDGFSKQNCLPEKHVARAFSAGFRVCVCVGSWYSWYTKRGVGHPSCSCNTHLHSKIYVIISHFGGPVPSEYNFVR